MKNKGKVLYRLPGEQEIYYLEGEVIQPKNLTLEHEGFVIAPFHEEQGQLLSLLIPDIAKTLSAEDVQLLSFEHTKPEINHFIDRNAYLGKVNKAKLLFDNEFRKVVLSRRKKVEEFQLCNATDVFLKLNQAYPGSFVYVFSSEYTGTWGGATPELFLSYSNSQLKTMALAGTIALKDTSKQDIYWEEKEKEEHQIVELFIENVLREYAGTFQKSGPSTEIVGSLAHLLSQYWGNVSEDKITSLIKTLHPTPAVCGLPKDKSYAVIQEIETYNRAYYTGFIGPWNYKHSVQLFVNLRCMQFFNNHAVLYAGGGITAASDSENEWQETENKIRSITKIIGN